MFADAPLNMAWGYKYVAGDEDGISIHADEARVNPRALGFRAWREPPAPPPHSHAVRHIRWIATTRCFVPRETTRRRPPPCRRRDEARINLNLWLSDDDANGAPDAGGLVVYEVRHGHGSF